MSAPCKVPPLAVVLACSDACYVMLPAVMHVRMSQVLTVRKNSVDAGVPGTQDYLVQ